MGYNTHALLSHGLSTDDILEIIPDVFHLSDDALDFERASSYRLHPHFALAQLGDWHVIWDSRGKLVTDRRYLERFGQHRALSLRLRSSDDRYSFAYVEGGQVRREVQFRQFALHAQSGTPLGLEPQTLDEDALWQLMRDLTGITLEQLAAAHYRRVSLD